MGKKIYSKRIEAVNALAELERLGWDFTPDGEDEVKCRCPVHKDDTPSVQLNVAKNLWNCKASHCKAKGDIVSLLAHILEVERGTVLVDLGTRYDLETEKTIDPGNIDRMHEGIWDAGPLLQSLYDRGLTDPMIRKARIGFFKGRITIPVKNIHGDIVNVRRYLPGAPGHEKFKNTAGHGAPQLYQADQTKYDTVWICGGEMKALVAGWYLVKKKIGCVAASAGEGIWNSKWTKLLDGKDVYICMDVDNPGRKAAMDVGNAIFRTAKSVHIIDLPLDKEKHPKGDLNDYIGTEGARTSELLALMPTAREFIPTIIGADESLLSPDAIKTSLGKAVNPEFTGRRVQFEAVCVAMDDTPFLIPRQLQVVCDRSQNNCAFCPILNMEMDPDTGGVLVTVPAHSPGILQMVNSPIGTQPEAIRGSLGVPPCKSVIFNIKAHYKVMDVRLSPQLSIGSGRTVNIVQPALVVDKDLEMNSPYDMTAVIYPHPKNQQAIALVESATEAVDNLTSYAPSRPELAALKVFRPEDWTLEGLGNKIGEIYADLEANVTGIFGRREIHSVLDLTFHSVIAFRFDSRLTHGWVNSIVLGDSAQGKSETAIRFMEHYGLGERFDCKNATVAGLLGGLAQLGTRWFVSWGVIPTHDRRLVVLDEVKGASVDVLAKLTDMRSSGIAELGKIERRRAHARTRLAFISNPRGRRTMGTYNFGIEAIRDLIGNLEDVRRFDLGCVVSSTQIDAEFIVNVKRNRPVVEHQFTSELCRRLVLWGWTRSIDQIKFEPDAISEVYDQTLTITKMFSEALPLIDRGTASSKLARLAVALAVRTFSTTADPDEVLVRKCHVQWIAALLVRIYTDPVFGYGDFTKAQTKFARIGDPNLITKHILQSKYPRDLIENLLYADTIRVEDFEAWCDVEFGDAQKLMSFLVRKRAIFRKGRDFVKSPDFITLLKSMEEKAPVEAMTGPDEEF
jgi:hypothetical protein